MPEVDRLSNNVLIMWILNIDLNRNCNLKKYPLVAIAGTP